MIGFPASRCASGKVPGMWVGVDPRCYYSRFKVTKTPRSQRAIRLIKSFRIRGLSLLEVHCLALRRNAYVHMHGRWGGPQITPAASREDLHAKIDHIQQGSSSFKLIRVYHVNILHVEISDAFVMYGRDPLRTLTGLGEIFSPE